MSLPSALQIGEAVKVEFFGGRNDGVQIFGYVRAATFASGKVRYSVFVLAGDPPDVFPINPMDHGNGFTLFNVDSAIVFPVDEPPIRFATDNLTEN